MLDRALDAFVWVYVVGILGLFRRGFIGIDGVWWNNFASTVHRWNCGVSLILFSESRDTIRWNCDTSYKIVEICSSTRY